MIGVIGAGAFGSALAVALGREGRAVTLWARDADHVADMARTRANAARLPGVALPKTVSVTAEIADLAGAEAVLLSLPMQALRGFLGENPSLNGLPLVACCKGVDLTTLKGPTALIEAACTHARFAVVTGPSLSTAMAACYASAVPTGLCGGGGGGGGRGEGVGHCGGICGGRGRRRFGRRGAVDAGLWGNDPAGAGPWRQGRNAGGAVGVWRSGADLHLGAIAQFPLWAGVGGGAGL